MVYQILDSELKVKVRKDDELMLKLAKANQVRVGSVSRWLIYDDVILTTATNLQIIREHFGYDERVPLTEEREVAES